MAAALDAAAAVEQLPEEAAISDKVAVDLAVEGSVGGGQALQQEV